MSYFLFSCNKSNSQDKLVKNNTKLDQKLTQLSFDSPHNTIHVMVALCDNEHQGIVPVPSKIGNGEDPNNNLYWGCAYGVRTYFKNSSLWKEVKRYPVKGDVLERIVFKHKVKDYYIVADAYRGKEIKATIEDFLNSSAGKLKDTIHVKGKELGIYGNSKVLTYIGHNGLMDFSLDEDYTNVDQKSRDVIILACKSKSYFSNPISSAKANPLVWTTNFMAPEAYTLHDALEVYINEGSKSQIVNAAAKAYSKFQKCSYSAASKLLVEGD